MKTANEVTPNQVTYLRYKFTHGHSQPLGSARRRSQTQEVRYTSVKLFKSMFIRELDDTGDNGNGHGDGESREAPDPTI